MKIVDNTISNSSFKEIAPGELFKWGRRVWVKLPDSPKPVDVFNAFALGTGDLRRLQPNDPVLPVQEILIK